MLDQIEVSDLLAWFRKSAAGRKIIAEREQAELKSRQELIDELARVRAEQARIAPELDAARDRARAAYERAVHEMEAKFQAFQRARGNRNQALAPLEHRESELRLVLSRMAPVIVREFRESLLAEAERLRSTSAISERDRVYLRSEGTHKTLAKSNALAVGRRSVACVRAWRQAEDLAFMPVAAIEPEIARLRDALPATDLFE